MSHHKNVKNELYPNSNLLYSLFDENFASRAVRILVDIDVAGHSLGHSYAFDGVYANDSSFGAGFIIAHILYCIKLLVIDGGRNSHRHGVFGICIPFVFAGRFVVRAIHSQIVPCGVLLSYRTTVTEYGDVVLGVRSGIKRSVGERAYGNEEFGAFSNLTVLSNRKMVAR